MALTKLNYTGQGVLPHSKMPSGSVLQVLNTIKTDTFEYTGTAQTDITGLSVTITPKFATSKILITFNVHITGDDAGTGLQLFRGSTALGTADTASSRMIYTVIGDYSPTDDAMHYSGGNQSMTFLDSPNTTSATIYKIKGQVLSSGFRVNKTRYDTDNGNSSRGISTITATEIAA
jgi:hypothetical protein